MHPVLETKKLRIDRLTTTDAGDFYRYRSMPEVAKFQAWAPESEKDAEKFISDATVVPFDQPGTWFQLALRDSATEKMVGEEKGGVAQVLRFLYQLAPVGRRVSVKTLQ